MHARRIGVLSTPLALGLGLCLVPCSGDGGTAPETGTNDNGPGETPEIQVNVSPASVTLAPGESRQVTASFWGSTDTSVTWAVASGPATVTSSGLYTAPATIDGESASATVRATFTADPQAGGQAQVTIQRPPAGSEAKIVRTGYCGSQAVHDLGEGNARIGVQAVDVATQLGGEGTTLIVTGTLSQGPQNDDTHSPDPEDRLRVSFNSGSEIDDVIQDFDGDIQQDPEGFLGGNHRLSFRAVSEVGSTLRSARCMRTAARRPPPPGASSTTG